METPPNSKSKDITKPRRIRIRPGERRAFLLLGDLLVSIISLYIALYIWASWDQWLQFSLEFLKARPPWWFFFLPLIWIVLLVDLYDDRRAGNWQETLNGVGKTALFGLGIYLLVFFFYRNPKFLPRRGVLSFVIVATILTLLWRYLYIRIFTAPGLLHRTLLVGAGETGKTLLKVYNGLTAQPFNLVGIIDDDPSKIGKQIEGYTILGGNDILLDTIYKKGVSDIIVAISGEMQGQMFQVLLDAQEQGVEITRMPVVYEELLGRVPIRYLETDWILRSFVDKARVSGFYNLGKRLLDIIGGLVGISILLICFPFVSLAILIDNGWPIFYSQVRSGRGAQPYKIHKFRTMRTNAEENGLPQWAEENDARATRVGKLLRKTHLDELPQFINVLRGEMSLVGPRAERPELVSWFEKHVPFYRARLLVKPGITGWAQVNYGYASSIEETMVKLEYDLYYILHRNLLIDLVILLRTPATVMGFRGR